jgi:lipopolysaccharide export system protein LptA
MAARDASAPVRFARRGTAAALVVLVAVVAWFLIVRRPRPAPETSDTVAPAGQRIDRKEGVQHLEYKDGKIWADVRADRFFLGDDGMNHLEGAVEILDDEGVEGRRITISADTVVYDPAMVHFTISGHVRIVSGDLRFESDSFEYDKSLKLFRTDRDGVLASDRLSGSGREFAYAEDGAELRMSGGFRLEVKEGPQLSGTAVISGETLRYRREEKTGQVEGRARVSYEKGEGEADGLSFRLSKDGRFLLSSTFEGRARILFGEGRESRALEAAVIGVRMFPGSSRVSEAEAREECRLSVDGPDEPSARVRSGALRLTFGREGRLAGWKASGSAAMSLDEKGGEKREVEGEEISYTGEPRLFAVRGASGRTARMESEDSRVEAPAIGLDLGPGDIQASGGVKCLMKARPDAPAFGFFPRDSSLFIACERMKSADGGRRLSFDGDVRIWQGEDSLLARSLEVWKETGEIKGRGAVKAGFLHPQPGASEERRVEVQGNEIEYSPRDRTAVFRGGGSVRMPDARLSAATVFVGLREGSRDIRSLRAEGDVALSQGNCEGRGGQAVYDPEADTVVLTGRPILVEKGKGTSRGDQLTFHLGDGRILIENKGQGRSITVVKS